MNRYIYTAFTALLLALLLGACQNDGHIGYLYGTWRVDSYTVDGVTADTDWAVTTLSFQSDIIMVETVHDEYGTYSSFFGSWTEQDDLMIIDFDHVNDNGPTQAPPALGWTNAGPMEMRVSDRSGRRVTWTYTDAAGAVHVYRLHKTY